MYSSEKNKIIREISVEKKKRIQKLESKIDSRRQELKKHLIIIIILVIIALGMGICMVITFDTNRIIFDYCFAILSVEGIITLLYICIYSNVYDIDDLKESLYRARKNLQESEYKRPSKCSIFLSFAIQDVESLNIKSIYRHLQKENWTNEVYFWNFNAYDNIVLYMNEKINVSEVFVLFCSRNSIKSDVVKKEWTTAEVLGKKIIPIFQDINDIPPFLRNGRGIPTRNYDPIYIVKLIREIINGN